MAKRVLLVEPRTATARALSAALNERANVIGVVSRAGEGLERLSRLGGADVVIAAEHLTGEIGGASFLDVVAARWPEAKRILLKTDSEAAKALSEVVEAVELFL